MTERKRVDDDWKRRAAEEKAKIAQQLGGGPAAGGAPRGGASGGGAGSGAAAGAGAGAAGAGAGDPTGGAGAARTDQTFVRLVSTIGGQAMMALGLAEDPHTGERFLDLDLARQSIDMLGALDAKTRGNLSAEEDALLGDILHQLRITYTQRVQQAQAAATREAPPGRPGTPGR